MGSSQTCSFKAAQVSRRPEELSAEVLRSLMSDVESQMGVRPDQAVIAVPALFELPQVKATSEAARLAGFSRVETIQEPVASALSSGWNAEESKGAWLVYDLGGGTFDASLLESQEGLLRVVGHDGDNFLGGRDFDFAIVDCLIERIEQEAQLKIERSHPEHREAIAKLKIAAEEAKIELSRDVSEVTVLLDGIQIGDAEIDLLELPLTKEDFEKLSLPLVDRTLRVCRRLMAAHGARSLERIVLVGGPTMMPSLRRRLEAELGAPFGTGLDPMHLVAEGAALFAATAGLSMAAKTKAVEHKGPKLWLQYPAMTPDTSPFVVGRALSDTPEVEAVQISSLDESFQSDWAELEADGTFGVMLSLKRRASNRFKVQARLKEGRVVEASPPQITVVHGVSIGDPPLARSIGVARADNGVAVYFERGAPLPCRKTFTHRTVERIQPGDSDYALRVPIVQGDFPFAHLCRLVGVIEIPAQALKNQLPAGSVIELTMEVDRGGAMTASASIPSQELLFEHVENLVAPAVALNEIHRLIVEQMERAAKLRGDAFRSGDRTALSLLSDFESLIASLKKDVEAACGGDQDALEKSRRALIECDGMLGDVEAACAWPDLNHRVHEEHVEALFWVDQYGTPPEKRALAQSVQGIERSLRAKNPQDVERHLGAMIRLRTVNYLRDPQSWFHELDHVASRVEETSSPRKAQSLVQTGRKAETAGDRAGVERAVRAVWGLLPPDTESRSLGFNSGVT